MDRLACVNLPGFPLQLLLRRHPDWANRPAAVVVEDKPQAAVLWANQRARRAGVLPGSRYAAAVSLAPGLRAGVVAQAEVEEKATELTHSLMRFTPEVEPCAEEPGVFWLNGLGLGLLYPSFQEWGRAVHGNLRNRGFHARIAVGFTRFGTYAAAKAGEGVAVFTDPSAEREAAREIPLGVLDLDPDCRDTLFKLKIRTVGDLLSLPAGGLEERFGPKARRLYPVPQAATRYGTKVRGAGLWYGVYRTAAGDLWAPLRPFVPEEAAGQRLVLDDPETDRTRLLFLIKQLLHPLLVTLAARSEAVAELELGLLVDRDGWRRHHIRPAEPTLDSARMLDLVRLRLEAVKLSGGVIEVELEAAAGAATREQLRLFTERPTRDLDAANRALARLRAEFGDHAVVRARLTHGHLPEARFTWEPLTRVKLPRNDLNGLDDWNISNCSTALREKQSASGMLVRRIFVKPIPLPAQPRWSREDGWLILGAKYGAVERLIGPYLFSGGWWAREIHREYYFAETRQGNFLWVYHDRLRRRWFLQGMVE